jgi:hypothetical protein
LKNKLTKRNKVKLTKLFKIAERNDMYLCDFMSLKKTIAQHNNLNKKRKKCEEVLLWGKATKFLSSKWIVPIAYKTKYGKLIDAKSSRVFSSEDEMNNARNRGDL